MDLSSYAQALAQAQALVPNYDQQRALQLSNRAQQFSLGQAQLAAADTQQREDAFRSAVSALPDDADADAYGRLIAQHPQHAAQIKDAWNLTDKSRRDAEFNEMATMWAALSNGRTDLAAAHVKRRLDAQTRPTPGVGGIEAPGQEDADDRQVYDDLTSNDPARIAGVRRQLGIMLASVGGSDKFASNLGAIQKQDEGYTLSDGQRRYDTGNNLVAAAPYKPQALHLRDGDRDTIVEYQPSAGPLPMGQGAAPLLSANNNPGNLEASPYAEGQPGYVGSVGGVAQFSSPAEGAAAHQRLLDDSYFGAGINTIQGVVEKYAPAVDPADQAAYVAALSRQTGINPRAPITTKAGQNKVGAAMRSFETRYERAEVPAIRVLATGAPKPQYRMMTPAEVAAKRGLDPSRAYQISPQGRISAVPGPRASRGGGRGSGGDGRPHSGSSSGSRPPSTLAGVMAPIFQKVAQGGQLTAGEQQALSMYQSRRTRSARSSDVAEGATATGPRGAKIVRRNGQWVRQ